MSYSISLYIDTGGPEPAHVRDVGNYTSNVSGMWFNALGHSLADLKDQTAGDAIPALDKAIAAMKADPATYRAMEPANGWGNYVGALAFLRELRDACTAHPKTTIHIWN